VIFHPDRSHPRPISLDRDEVVAAEGDLSSDELSPESRESSRVSTVQRNGRQASYSHSVIVEADTGPSVSRRTIRLRSLRRPPCGCRGWRVCVIGAMGPLI